MRRRGLLAPLARFLAHEAFGGILLIAAAIAALLIANGPLAPAYRALLRHRLGPMDTTHWINDGMMSLFFLVVGLEVKRALVQGSLADLTARRLPILAAVLGMAAPALIYLAIAWPHPGAARGWAIPAATDIAFALAVLTLVGRRAPASLRPFLAMIAIVDDIGAVLVIALFYTAVLHPAPLAVAALLAGGLIVMNRCGVGRLWPYLVVGAALWVATLLSGLHPTVAGVVLALVLPLGPAFDALEHAVEPWVSYAIVPLFGFANAGVPLAGISPYALLQPIPLGIILGLVLGKQAGVGGAMLIARATRFAPLPEGASAGQLYGIALLSGIGFTMSLFIGGLAFHAPASFDAVRLGVLVASLVSALAGCLMLSVAGRAGARHP